MTPVKAIKHSGLQKQVLSTYRQLLRASVAALHSPDPNQPVTAASTSITNSNTSSFTNRLNLYSTIRSQFRANQKSVPVSSVAAVEYLLRRAKNSLEMVKSSAVDGVAVQEPIASGRRWFAH
ncbi:hypothetical protein CcCBS67573_g06414 [Chytriomyces confervae]|uniref:Mitochondrial zinc maintenance protein 1, mitochondrial n=1 Tax=Chytriomyces confervae TaxID=246404 RepID=A0A507F514_9FUNG|nr:hypothetical protein CcCBS67573_g06414 [Chytriomyces confervae]